MKQILQQGVSQQLTLTPQLQQSIRLLQLSALELKQEIAEALAANPFLDRDEPTTNESEAAGTDAPEPVEHTAEERAADPTPIDDAPDELYPASSWGHGARDASDDDADIGSITPSPRTLREHLLEQVSAANLSDRDRLLVCVLVEALDEHGYLRQSLPQIASLFPFDLPVTSDELQVALAYLQSLDPAGVGARSLAECLELQLKELPPDTGGRDLALAIVQSHLELLASHDTARLLRALRCDEAALRDANCLIRRLDPRPGARFGTDDVHYVVADVMVKKVHGKWIAATNPEVVPQIRINRIYADILKSNRKARAAQIGQQLQEARWLVRSVRQRFATIQRVAQAIVDRQSRFFDYGAVAMKPLVLRDIAGELDLHPSTVSRVTGNKFMATPRGLIEFRYFFAGHVHTAQGAQCSSTAVRALIKEIIAEEDAGAPLSDVKVAKALGRKGIRVARRTVTKYRVAMKIPAVEARRLARETVRAAL